MAFDPLSLAYHEAGHAVVARHFGCELIDVWVNPNGQNGEAKVDKIDIDGLNAEQQVFVALAGIQAQTEAGYLDVSHDLAWSDDILEAYQVLSDPTLDDIGVFGERLRELIQHPPIWSAVEALAAVLAERHVINGATAMSIIDPILSGFPGHKLGREWVSNRQYDFP
jgi:hypothetical protein